MGILDTHVDIFRGDNGRWYFHRVATNHRITAGSQGYDGADRSHATTLRQVARVRQYRSSRRMTHPRY